MSDKLVLEFFDNSAVNQPVVTVLALYGGDNPKTAAETLANFFFQISDIPGLDWADAGALAARFMALQQELYSESASHAPLSAVPIARQTAYNSQLVRVRGNSIGPSVEFVRDKFTKQEEIAVAAYVLDRCGVAVAHCAT